MPVRKAATAAGRGVINSNGSPSTFGSKNTTSPARKVLLVLVPVVLLGIALTLYYNMSSVPTTSTEQRPTSADAVRIMMEVLKLTYLIIRASVFAFVVIVLTRIMPIIIC
jgi:hypothetical protein